VSTFWVSVQKWSVLLKGVIVEDVRTGFEKRGDISVIIPEIRESILL